jgi:hypothetical protein
VLADQRIGAHVSDPVVQVGGPLEVGEQLREALELQPPPDGMLWDRNSSRNAWLVTSLLPVR